MHVDLVIKNARAVECRRARGVIGGAVASSGCGLPSVRPAATVPRMFCGLHLACRTARVVARGSVRLLALGLLLRLSRP